MTTEAVPRAAAASLPATPYKGLTHYSVEDTLFFFGRTREVENVVANLMASRLTLLYGESGVGKSSLLRAGVLQYLREIAIDNVRRGKPPRFVVVVFPEDDADDVRLTSWRDDVLAGIAGAIERAVAALGVEVEEPPREATFDALLAAWTKRLGSDLLIVLDQFEEYLLYHEEHGPGTLAGELPRAVNRRDLRASFLISIREDALARLDRFKTEIPNLFDNYLRVDHLDRRAAEDAIRLPLERWHELGGQSVSVEDALVEAVLDDLPAGKLRLGQRGTGGSETAGASHIETPFLQLVLERLWEVDGSSGTLRLATYEKLGRAEAIVRTHLDHKMDELPESAQHAAAMIFQDLVTPSGQKIAYTADDLAMREKLPPRQVDEVLERLCAGRILRPVAPPPNRPRDTRYEIFHDVLADAVLGWRVRHESQRELERERAEASRRNRRLLRVIAIALVALAAMTAVAVYALTQRSEARRQASRANAAQLVAEDRARAERLAKASAQRAAATAIFLRQEAQTQARLAKRHQKEAVKQTKIAEHQREVARTEAENERAAKQEAQRSAVSAHESQREALRRRHEALVAAAVARQQRKKAFASAQLAEKRGRQARDQRRRALAEARRANARAFAEEARALLSVRPEQSVLLASKAAKLERTPFVEDVLRASLAAMRVRRILPGGGGAVQSASFSRDGSLVLTTSARGGARVFDERSGKRLRTKDRNATAAAFDPGGSAVATGDRDGRVRLWRSRDGRMIRELGRHGSRVASVSFSEDGQQLVTASDDGTARVWRVATGTLVSTLDHEGPVSHAFFSPDGALVATVSRDRQQRLKTRIYDASSGRLLHVLDELGVTTAKFSPDGSMLATASSNRTTKLWRPRTGALVAVLPQPDGGILDVAFSPDGSEIATAGRGGSVAIWNVATGRQLEFLPGATNFVSSVAFSPDGRFVVAGSRDKDARVYRVSDGAPVAVLAGHGEAVVSAVFSGDGRFVLTGSDDGTARIWDPATNNPLQVLGRHEGPVSSAAFSPDGRLAVSASDDGTARIWRLQDRKELHVLRHDGPVAQASFSRDGRLVLTASDDGTARIWDAASGSQLRVLRHGGAVADAELSRNGRLVVTASADKTAGIWAAGTGKELHVLAHDRAVAGAAFSPDAALAVTWSGNAAFVWSTGSGKLLHTLRRNSFPVTKASFSPDGRLVLTAGADGVARLWNARSGALVAELRGHTDALHDAEFSRQGRFVVTGSDDADARIWRVAAPHRVQVLRGHFGTVAAASFSPDGRWVLTAGPTTAGLWWRRTGRLFYPTGPAGDPFLRGHTKTLTSATFAPDGKRILTSSLDGTVRTYVCTLCGRMDSLIALADARLRGLRG